MVLRGNAQQFGRDKALVIVFMKTKAAGRRLRLDFRISLAALRL
jgi:hypothetical protein